MKKYIEILAISLIAILGISAYCSHKTAVKYRKQLSEAKNTIKAYEAENSDLFTRISVFQLSLADLSSSKDSLTHKLDSLRKECKIKDRKILSMSYIETTITKIDSVFIHDTIFQKGVHIDTTLNEAPWYKLNLGLEYPGTISVGPEFHSELSVFTSEKKEPLNPSKSRFINFFKKKRKFVEVTIDEANPYIKLGKSRFIEVVK